MRLLTYANPKLQKGRAKGWLTCGLHLAPASLSGQNVCPWSTPGCRAACLNTAGRGRMQQVQDARLARTHQFNNAFARFLEQLNLELDRHERRARAAGLRPACRLNATSDLPWEAYGVMARHPRIRFYDYTKSPRRIAAWLAGAMPKNYHLMYSLSEVLGESDWAADFLRQGVNVAVVFAGKLPKRYMGARVIDGDAHDLRFLDPKGVVVGLSAKGDAKRDTTGFVKKGD